MNGLLLIDKPSGITSSACVYSLRKTLNKKKIGSWNIDNRNNDVNEKYRTDIIWILWELIFLAL